MADRRTGLCTGLYRGVEVRRRGVGGLVGWSGEAQTKPGSAREVHEILVLPCKARLRLQSQHRGSRTRLAGCRGITHAPKGSCNAVQRYGPTCACPLHQGSFFPWDMIQMRITLTGSHVFIEQVLRSGPTKLRYGVPIMRLQQHPACTTTQSLRVHRLLSIRMSTFRS